MPAWLMTFIEIFFFVNFALLMFVAPVLLAVWYAFYSAKARKALKSAHGAR